jgi:hypothetical protein
VLGEDFAPSANASQATPPDQALCNALGTLRWTDGLGSTDLELTFQQERPRAEMLVTKVKSEE